MAKATLGGNAVARKSPRIAFDRSGATCTGEMKAEANPPALPADLVAAILALVKEGTQSALRDLLGLSASGRRVPILAADTTALVVADEPAEIIPAVPDAATEIPSSTLPPEPQGPTAPAVRLLGVDELEPVIVLAGREARAELGQHPLLQSPGFYAGFWQNRTAYPGFGESVGARAGTNPELGGANPAAGTVCITDRHGRLTTQQALVGERLFGQLLQQPGGYSLRNKLPAGAAIEPESYDKVRLFVARACLSLREAGVAFTTLPAAALLLPPAKASAFRPMEPDTQIYRLTVAGLRSHLANENGEWRLLAGSEVRVGVQPSAYGPALMARAELLHCGGLLRTGPVLTTTWDLRFDSRWAAAHFVLGQKPGSDVWKSIPSGSDARRPRA